MNWAVVVTLSVVVATFTCAGFAGELGDQLSVGIKLTESERAGLEPALAHYYALNGSKEALGDLLARSAGCGCRESCLTDVVQAVTRAMKAGVRSADAANLAIEALDAVQGRCAGRGVEVKPEEMSRAVVMSIDMKLKDKEPSSMPNGASPGLK